MPSNNDDGIYEHQPMMSNFVEYVSVDSHLWGPWTDILHGHQVKTSAGSPSFFLQKSSDMIIITAQRMFYISSHRWILRQTRFSHCIVPLSMLRSLDFEGVVVSSRKNLKIDPKKNFSLGADNLTFTNLTVPQSKVELT